MIKVVLEGFESVDQAMEFLNWYGGGGEQDFGEYLDCQESTDMYFVSLDYSTLIKHGEDEVVAKVSVHLRGEE